MLDGAPSQFSQHQYEVFKTLFGTQKVPRKEYSEENRDEKWKEKIFGGKYKIGLNLIS